MLLAMFGDTSLVNRWWNIPNRAFELKTPFEVYETDREKVANYITGYTQK